MIGGGSVVRPGEVSLAHGGVLFLDELPEFGRGVLEALRQPLEDGCVSLVRVRSRYTFPARFSLVSAMNPCRCGFLGDPRKDCRCTPAEIDRYRGRVSGPLLDRIDLQIEMPALAYAQLGDEGSETSAAIAFRVAAARERQRLRFSDDLEQPTNAAMTPPLIAKHCEPGAAGRKLLERAFNRLGLSARALHRLQKVARTIADLEGAQRVASEHLAEAIQYRALDRLVADDAQ